MTSELLIFGAYGALGREATASLIKKAYSGFYLFDKHIQNDFFTGNNIKNIEIGDLTSESEVKNAFDNIGPSTNKKFFLFSTIGGFWGGKDISETPLNEWDKMFDINLKTNYLIAKYFCSIVKQSAGGSICFTAASSALKPQAKRAAYDASKSALISFVKTLALEGADFNLSANALAPYIIDTASNRKWMPDSDFGSWVKPEEIGKLVDSIFCNYNFVSGNVFELAKRFETE